MDRERLKQVHQTDLTESKVNEDFVDWLKTKGPSWLLAILVAVCVYLVVVRFREGRVAHRHEAWAALAETSMPESFEDVAREYGEIDQIGAIARIEAANLLIQAVQRNMTVADLNEPRQPDDPAPEPLTNEQRDTYLKKAEGLFQAVADADDGSPGTTILGFTALSGLAAIAESRGDTDDARAKYEKAAARAKTLYPELEQRALKRAESSGDFADEVTLVSAAEAAALRGSVPPRNALRLDPAIADLVLPADDAGN